MHLSALLRCVGSAMVLGAALPAFASPFSTIYAFGDSGSDVGNEFNATDGLKPAPPYFAGRYSNGRIWVDDLARTFRLGPLVPSVVVGTGPAPAGQSIDYAWGGATSGAEGACCSAQVSVPTVVQQVERFSLTHGGIAPPDGLYTVRIGANDIFQAITDIQADSTTIAEAIALLGRAARDVAGAVHTLASEGAKTFIVPLVSDVGKTPLLRGNATSAALGTRLALSYNADLLAEIGTLIPSDGISVHFLDTFALIDAWVQDPAKFGYTDVTDACYVGPNTGGGTVCPNPNRFLFWDQEHLTAYANKRLAAAARELLYDDLPF